MLQRGRARAGAEFMQDVLQRGRARAGAELAGPGGGGTVRCFNGAATAQARGCHLGFNGAARPRARNG